jgi:hypothetical protein
MVPTRAAWFMIVGLAWMVLRGILGRTIPALDPGHVAQTGGVLLLVPLLSVLASLTVPLFFVSFLRHHDFRGQRAFRISSLLVATASVLSVVLVLVTFVGIAIRSSISLFEREGILGWVWDAVPFALVLSILVFLAVFAVQAGANDRVRRASVVAAVGAAYPVLLMVVTVVHQRWPEALTWYPEFSRSFLARGLGLAAAAALIWFLETFAVSYEAE